MNSTYEIGLLAKLAHQRILGRANARRLARHLKSRTMITNDEYVQVVLHTRRPCHC